MKCDSKQVPTNMSQCGRSRQISKYVLCHNEIKDCLSFFQRLKVVSSAYEVILDQLSALEDIQPDSNHQIFLSDSDKINKLKNVLCCSLRL